MIKLITPASLASRVYVIANATSQTPISKPDTAQLKLHKGLFMKFSLGAAVFSTLFLSSFAHAEMLFCQGIRPIALNAQGNAQVRLGTQFGFELSAGISRRANTNRTYVIELKAVSADGLEISSRSVNEGLLQIDNKEEHFYLTCSIK